MKASHDVKLPPLDYWRSSPCPEHEEWVGEDGALVTDRPRSGCRQCGVLLRRHQRVGVTWLYLIKRGLLADSVGTGKTFHAAGTLALMKQRGELGPHNRAVIVMRAPALLQWRDELSRVLPSVYVETAMGTVSQRLDRYVAPWEVMLIGQQMLLRDVERLEKFPINCIFIDDVDALRNRENRTAWAVKRLARECERVYIMTGTPLQKRLHEMHSVLEPIGSRELFGSPTAFERRYVRTETMTIYTGRGRKSQVKRVVGYKNVDEFSRLIAPLALRRTAKDIEDVELPSIIPVRHNLELYKRQRERYDELKRGVVTLVREHGKELRQATALAKIHYGAQICAGLAALGEPDEPETSVKMDWIMDKVGTGVEDSGDLADEKVVIFINYKATIRAMQARLAQAGVESVTVWGDEPDKEARRQATNRFWDDPDCRVLMGTTAIEQSLNLQVARHLVNVDTILNPARMEQLSGRIRRDGSAHKSVYVHTLTCVDTQEERYPDLLAREQALIDRVWDEETELFDKLSPLALLQLIAS